MSSRGTPAIPPHVKPDVEVSLPETSLQLDLDLNPRLLEDGNLGSDSDRSASLDTVTKASDVLVQWTLPPDEALTSVSADFASEPQLLEITHTQESRLINYVDNQLLQVQRRFIKNQASDTIVYPLSELLADVQKVADLIWYSVRQEHGLFGQDEYLIRIVGDLGDWVEYYSMPELTPQNTRFYMQLFTTLQLFDARISLLIDGLQSTAGVSKMTRTGIVRLSPIISRLRLVVISKMEPVRQGLAKTATSADKELMNVLDIEIGRLFECILDRV